MSGNLIKELRQMADANGELTERHYRRLVLLAMAETAESVEALRAELRAHGHPVTDAKLDVLGQRDWKVLAGAAVAAVVAAVTAWLN